MKGKYFALSITRSVRHRAFFFFHYYIFRSFAFISGEIHIKNRPSHHTFLLIHRVNVRGWEPQSKRSPVSWHHITLSAVLAPTRGFPVSSCTSTHPQPTRCCLLDNQCCLSDAQGPLSLQSVLLPFQSARSMWEVNKLHFL